jgi:predicted transcriptional regulator
MDKNKQLTYGLGGLGVLLGSLGVFLLSERGREIVRSIARHLESAPESIEQLAEATQSELDRIQQTLNQIAARLEVIS